MGSVCGRTAVVSRGFLLFKRAAAVGRAHVLGGGVLCLARAARRDAWSTFLSVSGLKVRFLQQAEASLLLVMIGNAHTCVLLMSLLHFRASGLLGGCKMCKCRDK